MATDRKIAHPKRRTKKGAENPEIRLAAARSGINLAKAQPAAVRISRDELERWDSLLARAQREAIHAAPRRLPWRGDGQEAAIQCFDTVRTVRESIAHVAGSDAESQVSS